MRFGLPIYLLVPPRHAIRPSPAFACPPSSLDQQQSYEFIVLDLQALANQFEKEKKIGSQLPFEPSGLCSATL